MAGPSQNPALDYVSPYFEGSKMLEYLTARNRVPTSEYASLPLGEYGNYSFGRNKIQLAKSAYPSFLGPEDYSNIALHEFTHAVQSSLLNQYTDSAESFLAKNKSPQFEDAYRKLHWDYHPRPASNSGTTGKHQVEELAKLIAPTWAADNYDYRASNHELQAFGLANSVTPNLRARQIPPHMDATAATEFMILLDLAMRDLQQKQKAKQK